MLYSYTNFSERSLKIFRKNEELILDTEADVQPNDLPNEKTEVREEASKHQPELTNGLPSMATQERSQVVKMESTRAKQMTMSSLSIVLTILSILLAFRYVELSVDLFAKFDS
jgi:hypothetical protein